MRKGFWKGLRIIDLAIMLGLFLLLASIVYVRYDNFACRSMQSEAKFSLEQIYAAQELYHAQHDSYASLDLLLNKEQRVVINNKYYNYSDADEPKQDSFSVRADARDNYLIAGEAWLINEKKELLNISNSCVK